jgi:hypothetical protein
VKLSIVRRFFVQRADSASGHRIDRGTRWHVNAALSFVILRGVDRSVRALIDLLDIVQRRR